MTVEGPLKDSPVIKELERGLSTELDRIAGYFLPGVKVTLVVRNPRVDGREPGAGDVVIGNDCLDKAIGAIQRQIAAIDAEKNPKRPGRRRMAKGS